MMIKKNSYSLFTCFSILLFLLSFKLTAQKFTAQTSRNQLAVGELFQISFTLNASGSNFKAPNLSDFDVYSGPNQSTSMQIVNGNMSQSISLSYMLSPKREGRFTIAPASIVVNGNKIESNSIAIDVKGNANQQNAGSRSSGSNQSVGNNAGVASASSGDDVFIKTTVSKKSCFLGEQVVVSHKIYSKPTLRGFQNYKMPNYNGFWSQNENNKNKQIQLSQENVDGSVYYVADFSTSYLFPQRSGQLTIEPMEVECVVRRKTNRQPQNIFEQFFGGGGYEDAVVKAKSKTMTIDVKALPENNKPANFNGAVGNFSLKAEISKEKVKENESINLKLSITGRGNIKLTDAPKINFPEGFETYDPKISESYSEAGNFSGTKTYDYLLIPRKSGEFTINNLSFSYFDPEKKSYVNIPAPEFKIEVTPDPNGSANGNSVQAYVPKTTIEEKRNDIRYIKTGDLKLEKADQHFFNSWKHYALLALPLLCFTGFIVSKKSYDVRNSDVVAVKQRKAARLAKKQLQKAEVFLKQNNKDGFYQEVSIALYNYISNKLNIPIADLSKDNISLQLTKQNISETTISKLNDTLNDCDIARYAPAAVSNDIQIVYNNTIELIKNIEDETKA